MEVFTLPIDSVHLDPANVRRHPARNIAAIRASLARFGQQRPILIDAKGVVRAGNGTVEAARALGWTEIRAVRTGLKGSEATAYAIADNRTAELAEWEDVGLASTLQALRADDIDLEDVGFSLEEIDELLARVDESSDDEDEAAAEDPGAQVDRAEELLQKWGCAAGQLWSIGDHRLLCGDSTNPEDVARLMDGRVAVLMNTDPPYGIDYSRLKDGIPRSGFVDHQQHWGDIENDTLTDGGALQAFLESAIRAAVPHLREDSAFYLWHPMLTQGTFFAAAAAAAADILIHRQVVWVKPGFVLTRSGMYHWRHELCFYGWRRGHQPPWYGDKSQDTVWNVGRDDDRGLHQTQKPVELFRRPILNHTRRGEVVYEPFAGSGSQFVAAEQSGRVCFGIEIIPKYVAVTLERLAGMGLEPKLVDQM